jgi:DNA-binding beta-propeller fold protein YncE
LFDVSSFADQVHPPSPTFTITGSLSPLAVAALDDQVFVTRNQRTTSDQIEVYSATTFQLTRNITVPGATGDLNGLTVSPTYNFLFVSDYNNYFVHRVSLSSTSTIKWSVCINPRGLSVNKAHNVLVACASGSVQEYTADGSLVRTLTESGSFLWHAIENNDGTLAISRYNTKNQVCLKSISGTVLNCFGTVAPGSGPGQLNYPLSLAVDRNGNIAVADYNNNRIIVLNPTLSEARTFSLPINTGVIYGPRGLWLDESRGRLYVAESSGQKRVLVFDNVYNLNEASTP